MKLVTPTETVHARLGELNGIRLICESGFDGIDYSMFHMNGRNGADCRLNAPDYKEHIKKVKSVADSYGVTFEQSHAPFPSQRETDVIYNKKMLDILARSAEISAMLGIEMMVVHPAFYKRHPLEKNIDFFNKIEHLASDNGIKIAIENVWGADKRGNIVPNIAGARSDTLKALLDSLDCRYFTACVDVGHCGLVGEKPEDMIRAMGERIGCFHIHDNDNKEDLHTLPYTVKLDWEAILRAIADTGYSGNFTLEADRFFAGMPEDLLPDAMRFMASTGREMIKRIEEMKAENG